ncbi:hypothetical protein PanWU01x14_176460, partial [Parasponia andersonii]
MSQTQFPRFQSEAGLRPIPKKDSDRRSRPRTSPRHGTPLFSLSPLPFWSSYASLT